jgi:hypothetical protein
MPTNALGRDLFERVARMSAGDMRDSGHCGSGSPIWLRSSGLRTFDKRVADREISNRAAVLHVFTVENVTAGLSGGGDNKCIVEG